MKILNTILPVDNILANHKLACQMSFSLQRESLEKQYPHAIFAKPNQTLKRYIEDLLLKQCEFEHHYIHETHFNYLIESLLYLYNAENPYYISMTKELYPFIAKKHHKKSVNIERNIRTVMEKVEISDQNRQELFALPISERPTNGYFLCNLAQYIKIHYQEKTDVNLSPRQQAYFLENLSAENNISNILKNHNQRKRIQQFLYQELGHFHYTSTITQQILIDFIDDYIKNGLNRRGSFFNNPKIIEKWKIQEEEVELISSKIRFINKFANSHINPDTSKEIFGTADITPPAKEYILKVGDYLKSRV